MSANDEQIKMESRVTALEGNWYRVEKDIATIMTNHLPHLHDEVTKLSDQVNDKTTKLSDQVTDLRISIAKYIGIAVGAATVIQIVIQFIK